MTSAQPSAWADAYDYDDPIQPYQGNPQLGNLATPINSSGLVKAYINNLPAYRPGLSPFLRGLEIGMAHGYFLVGPEIVVGPLRETAHGANLSGLITAIYITVSACLGISIFALSTFQGDPGGAYNSHSQDRLRPLRNKDDWFQLSSGILLGSMGGAIFAYVLLENFDALDGMLRGAVNISQTLLNGAMG